MNDTVAVETPPASAKADLILTVVCCAATLAIGVASFAMDGPGAPSDLDGKPRYKPRIHSAHVKCIAGSQNIPTFSLDDGTIIHIHWMNSAEPQLGSCAGSLFVKSPMFESGFSDDPDSDRHDSDDYYFDHFVSD